MIIDYVANERTSCPIRTDDTKKIQDHELALKQTRGPESPNGKVSLNEARS